MKTIRNKTRKPLRVPIPGGKFLHLGPAKVGQVGDGAVKGAGFKRLIDAGEIEIEDDGAHGLAGGDRAEGGSESTHGHPQPTLMVPKGNR
jgi:hypothetical protein